MATKGKAPASRSLNYGLSGDILNRVSRSLDTGSKEKAIEEGISGITDAAGDFVQGLVDNKVAKREKSKNANTTYEAGMDAFGSRASWSTPETYDQFMNIEKEQRDLYAQAISNGNQAEADKILRTQKQRAIQTQAWKTSFDSLKDIELLELNPEDADLIGRLTSQTGDDFKVIYENDELKMQYKDINNQVRTVRGSDLDKIIAKNRKPIKEQEQIAGLTQALMENKSKLQKFDYSEASANVRKIITKDNIYSMMKGDLGGSETGSFLNSINSHPDFNRVSKAGMKLNIGSSSGLENVAGNDGVISGEEFMELTDNDRAKVVELMQKPENFEIAKYYLAEFITLAQQRKVGDYNPRIGNSNKRYDDLINEIENENN